MGIAAVQVGAGLLVNLLFFNQDGKTTLHARSQAVNELWIFHSRILDSPPQSEHGNHSCGNIFHLNKRHVFAQTDPRATLEDCELEGTLRDEMAVLVYPPLWLELEAVGTPDGVHTTHGVWVVSHPSTFAHESPVGQDVVVESVLGVQENRRIESHRFTEGGVQVMHPLQILV